MIPMLGSFIKSWGEVKYQPVSAGLDSRSGTETLAYLALSGAGGEAGDNLCERMEHGDIPFGKTT